MNTKKERRKRREIRERRRAGGRWRRGVGGVEGEEKGTKVEEGKMTRNCGRGRIGISPNHYHLSE